MMRKIVTGFLVLAAGVLLLAFNAGALPEEYRTIVFSWPSLLVVLGVVTLCGRKPNFPMAIMLLLVGGLFLLKKFHIPPFEFLTQNTWAMLLIIVGIIIICMAFSRKSSADSPYYHRCKPKRFHGRGSKDVKQVNSDYICSKYVLSGSEEHIVCNEFKGGEISCLLGGVEVNLTDSRLAEGTHVLTLNLMLGGAVVRVPADWNVEIRQNSILGGFSDKRANVGIEEDKSRTLIIKVSCLMGGGELNYRE